MHWWSLKQSISQSHEGTVIKKQYISALSRSREVHELFFEYNYLTPFGGHSFWVQTFEWERPPLPS